MFVSPFPFDTVLFDLDGTLVATDRFWPDAARAGTLEVFRARGIERPIPSAGEWMAMVGLPMDEAFAATFSDLDEGTRGALIESCAAKEKTLLQRGQAAVLDGVPGVLDELKAKGVRLGVASNCGEDYLGSMMVGLGLGQWIDEARCLASPGIRTKAEMIADLLDTFGSRSSVMVGDRRGDRDAAWANGLPHVHIPRGYGGMSETVEAEVSLDGIDELLDVLGERGRVLSRVTSVVGVAKTVAVTGMPFAGRQLFAADLRRFLASEGSEAAVIVAEAGEALPATGGVFRVHLLAQEDVLYRRAKGLGIGVGPVEALREERLPAYHAAFPVPPEGAILIDNSSAIAPRYLGTA